MSDADFIPFLARKLHTLPAHHVLAEVYYLLSLRGYKPCLGPDRLTSLDGFIHRCHQLILRHIRHLCFLVPPVLWRYRIPRCIHPPCIDSHTVIDIGKDHATGLGTLVLTRHTTFPTTIRHYTAFTTIRIFQIHLQQESHIITEFVPMFRIARIHTTAIPSRRYDSSQHILSFLQHVRHIVCPIWQTLVITGPPRSEFVIPHPHTVHINFIDAMRCHIQGSFADLL